MTLAEAYARLHDRLPQLRVLVVGDLMLDRYVWGKVSRISPEAPVPIVDVERVESRPGGAANVALNIAVMGAQVAVCGVVGNDDHGRTLLGHLRQDGFDTGLVRSLPDRITTEKTRVIGNQQQVLRVDHEVRGTIPVAVAEELAAAIAERITDFDAVIFEDYDKGLLSPTLIAAVTQAANAAGIPTIVDPKYRNFLAYAGVTLFKPNMKELNEALGIRISNRDIPGISAAVHSLRARMPHAMTLITLSENGVVAIDAEGQHHHLPAHLRKIADVSGAGDTVVALMALTLAAGLPLPQAAAIANLGGGLVCEEVGVVPISPERLAAEIHP
jgi:D-glycero-beta-D-manno-heptose-7-phosphate kinase